MSSRSAAALAALLLAAALVSVAAVTTPWQPLARASGPGGPAASVPVDPTRDFTPPQIARENAYHREVRPPAYAGLALGLLVTLVLGFTSWGARLLGALTAPVGGGWVGRVLVGGLALALLGRLVSLPFDARVDVVRRRYGLSTQTWGSWALDQVKAFALATGLLLVVLLALFALVRTLPRWWWLPAAAGAALLVVVVSFAYPLVVEPVFNRFTPMPAGELRASLFDLARRDAVRVEDVLVADASRRTTSLNAYVSGLGSTRRIVVYDTLLREASPPEVRTVVAHELGHTKARDVLFGTLLGALGAAEVVCVLYLVLTTPALLHRSGVDAPGDPRAIALVLAVTTLLSAAGGPLQLLVSRRVEARADVHALELTRDPETFIALQKRLAIENLSDLDPPPLVYVLFASHPTAPQRIALAREWQRRAVAVGAAPQRRR